MTVVCLSVVMGGQEAKSGKIDLVKMLDSCDSRSCANSCVSVDIGDVSIEFLEQLHLVKYPELIFGENWAVQLLINP